MQEAIDRILEAISEAAYKIGRYETEDKTESSARTVFILALTYGMLENRMCYEESEDENDAETKPR